MRVENREMDSCPRISDFSDGYFRRSRRPCNHPQGEKEGRDARSSGGWRFVQSLPSPWGWVCQSAYSTLYHEFLELAGILAPLNG